MTDNPNLDERERIRYEWMLSRIQAMKSLLVATILAVIGYSASAIGNSATYCEIVLLAIGSVLLVVALILAAVDAGAALFYNEKSQEGLGKKVRLVMYILLFVAAVFVLAAKVTGGIARVRKQQTPIQTPPNVVVQFGDTGEVYLFLPCRIQLPSPLFNFYTHDTHPDFSASTQPASFSN